METTSLAALERLDDRELLAQAVRLARGESRVTALLVAHLAEIDSRRLYLGEGYGSLFAYCVNALGLAEPAAYRRIYAARLARRYPRVLEALAEGHTTLAALGVLGPVMTGDNCSRLLAATRGFNVRRVDAFVTSGHWIERGPAGGEPVDAGTLVGGTGATMTTSGGMPFPGSPHPGGPGGDGSTGDVGTPATPAGPGRRLETGLSAPMTMDLFAPGDAAGEGADPTPVGGTPAEQPCAASWTDAAVGSEPAAASHCTGQPRHFVLRLGPRARDQLLEARDLLRHAIPSGDYEDIIVRALGLLIRAHRSRKFGARNAGNPGPSHPTEIQATATPGATSVAGAPGTTGVARSRRIPAAIRRAVWERDGGRCAFVGRDGTQCAGAGWLEYHHRVPFSRGGRHEMGNLELRCRAHNQYEELPLPRQ